MCHALNYAMRTDQTADDLRQLDPTTPFDEVGVVAAFRSAFVLGRFVNIYVNLPAEPGQQRGVQRFGLIEWSGVEAHDGVSRR